ncbi:fumarylacetoacetate hydrolase family protein [Actinotignum urinale]|nr:fumarylacetoacetate hydrolase family protein [Actinotignum urinale]
MLGDMKIARLSLEQGPRYAVLDEAADDYIVLKDDPLFAGMTPTGQRIPVQDAVLLSPMIPRSKALGFAQATAPGTRPEDVLYFVKPNTAVCGPNDPILIPEWAKGGVHPECELAVVIGRLVKDVPVERAMEAVFGYTVVNDVTGRDTFNGAHKLYDTWLPVGPHIVTDTDPSDFTLTTSVNGEEVATAKVADYPISIAESISVASHLCTLLPGDMVLLGTFATQPVLKPGDEVECNIDGIGTLRNPVMKA